MADQEPENEGPRRRTSTMIAQLIRRLPTRHVTIKEEVETIEPEKQGKHWTHKLFGISVLVQETVIFTGMLLLAYFLRFRKELFKTFYFPLESCTDLKYSYQYLEDSQADDNTNIRINQNAFYCVTFLIPLFLLFVFELGFHYVTFRRLAAASSFLDFLKISFPRRIFRFTSVFLIGIFVTSVATDVMKLLAAKPRPHFLTVCEPNLAVCTELPYCSDSDICKGDRTDAILEARFSFPSFHASHTMFIAAYMALYVHLVFKLDQFYTVKPVLVGTSVIVGFLGGFPRYQLNYNHGPDLLIGYIIGALVAAYLVFFILHKFQEKPPKKTIIYKRVIPDMEKVKRQESENNVNETEESENRAHRYLPPVVIDDRRQSQIEVHVHQEEQVPEQVQEREAPPTPPPMMAPKTEEPPVPEFVFTPPPPPPPPPPVVIDNRSVTSTEYFDTDEERSTSEYSDSDGSSGEEGRVIEQPCVLVSNVLESLRARPSSPTLSQADRTVSELVLNRSDDEDELMV